MVTSRLLLVTVLFVSAPLAAFAEATVGVKIAELRIKPDDQAFSRLKIPGGREVAVLGKSDDGRWIKVRTQIERGEDVIKLEGWLEATQLKGADPSSLSVASGGSSSGSSSDSAFGESSSGSEWGDAPAATTEAWDSAPASAPADSWDSAPASAPADSWDSAPAESSSDSMGSWDAPAESGSSSEPAPSSGGDEWESTDDSGSSDSGSSDDGW